MLIKLTLFLVAALLFLGLNTIFVAVATKDHSYIGRRMLLNMCKWQRRKLDAWAMPPLKQLLAMTSRIIFIDEATAAGLGRKLSRAGLTISPQEYIAKKYLIIAIGACPMVLFFFLRFYAGIGIGLLATVYALLKRRDSLDAKVKKKELIITQEMPRFVRTICRSLKSDRDLCNVITAYRKVAGAELGGELDILLAEMKSGNMQNALIHFENRIGTPEVFRLCGALRDITIGIDQTVTLDYMADDMARQHKENIRKELSVRPSKMRRTYYPAMAVCIAMIMYVLIVYVINNFTNLF